MAREWWNDGFFDMELAALLFDAEKMREGVAEAKAIGQLAGLKPNARILDAACGIGRHSLQLAKLGYAVVGVDSSAEYVAVAARQAKRQRLKRASFEKGELKDLYRFQSSCDLVLNLYTSFGYYNKASDNFEALKQMAACLRPGGRLIVELETREALERKQLGRDWQQTEKGYLLSERRWLDGGRRLQTSLLWVQGKSERETGSTMFVYSKDELSALFKRAGLKQVKAFADFNGKPYRSGGRLLLMGSR